MATECACGHESCVTNVYLKAQRERQAELAERLKLYRYVKPEPRYTYTHGGRA